MDQVTKYFRRGDVVESRTVGPVVGPYTVAVRVPEGAEEISREEYLVLLEEHRADAAAWRREQQDKTAAARELVYAEAIGLGFTEEAARILSGHRDG